MTDLLIYPDVVQWAVPLFIAAILAELLWITLRHRGGRYETRDAITSLIMGAGNVASSILLGFIAWGFFMLLWAITPLDLGTSLWVVVLCFVLDDLRYYWVHRFGHRIRWVWASHVNHHSSQHYNLSTALRQSWTGFLTLGFVFALPLVLLGFHPAMIAICAGFNLVYQFWIHTEAIDRMPRWFEAVMNTPSHHRVHHATNPRYLDRNYAGVFIVWDKLFGTFEPEVRGEKIRYGIVKQLGSFNLLWSVFHEWIGIAQDMWRAPWKHKLSYLLREPGWTHDGSRETSDQIRAAWRERNGERENSVSSDNLVAGKAEAA